MAVRKPKFNPGFQSPAIGGFTPAFQSIPGLTPSGGGIGAPAPLPLLKASQTPLPQQPKQQATPTPLDPLSLIQVNTGGGLTQQQVQENKAFRNKREIARILAGGGHRALPTQQELEAFAGGLPGFQEPGAGFTPGQPGAEGLSPDMAARLQSNLDQSPLGGFASSVADKGLSEVRAGFKLTAIAINAIRTLVTGKKPLSLALAQETFDTLSSSLKLDIQDINLGTQDPSTVGTKLSQAEGAIGRYEAYQKDYGKLNLRYWTDEGKDSEAEIIRMKETLFDLRQDLQLARQTWLTRQFLAQPAF